MSDSGLPFLPLLQVVAKFCAPLSTPGLWFLFSVLVQAFSISYPDHGNSSLTNFIASDFGFIHLYTVFLHVVISSNFFNLYMMMSFPSLSAPPPNLNLEQTHGHLNSPCLILPSCLPHLTNTFSFIFFQFSHTSIPFQMMILLLWNTLLFFLLTNFYLSFKC